MIVFRMFSLLTALLVNRAAETNGVLYLDASTYRPLFRCSTASIGGNAVDYRAPINAFPEVEFGAQAHAYHSRRRSGDLEVAYGVAR